MISSKAIELISTFSKTEFNDFGSFVSSPYFNRESVMVKFYDVLKKYYPSFDNRNFTKEKVFTKLYPGKKYNDGVMRNILSSMLELAETFLGVEQLVNDKVQFNFVLMKELSERKQLKLFERREIRAAELLETLPENEIYFYYRSLFFTEKRNHETRLKSTLYQNDMSLLEISDSLMKSFLISILNSYTHITNSNMKLYDDKYRPYLNEGFEAFADREAVNLKELAYFNYYYNAFKLSKTEDEKYFYELKKLLQDPGSLTKREIRDIFSNLTNFCYHMMNKGVMKFRKEQFLLHKEQIATGRYKADNKNLSHIKYMSVVITGIDAGEIEWIEGFIEKYKAELDDSNRENTYNFCTALIYYHKKNFGSSLEWAAKVKTDDLSYKHQLKSLYLKVYFDMNDVESFYSHVDSYRHFLSNQKSIPADTRNAIGNYLNFTKKLFDIKNAQQETGFELAKLKEKILETALMINKPWLLDKIDEISNKASAG
jgi:hypothetical protein